MQDGFTFVGRLAPLGLRPQTSTRGAVTLGCGSEAERSTLNVETSPPPFPDIASGHAP